jgi:Glycosyl hydrolase family 79, N-terminal domain
MMRKLLILLCTLGTGGAIAEEMSIAPAHMARVGTIDARFQSYNIEMVEVTGGRFWKPYASSAFDASDKYAYRAPIDLTNARLRKLAAALAPAYVRVSGTWANATYFADSDESPSTPPAGFDDVLTRRQWKGVIDFSRAVGAEIVTSFAVSRGIRDAASVWTPKQASRLLGYSASIGGRIAAAEFMNEPDVAVSGVLPDGYDAAAYRRDFANFRSFVKQQAPAIILLGPGTADTADASSDLLDAPAAAVDAISYHHYGALSERCAGAGAPDGALSEHWLAQTDRTLDFYRQLRDRVAPNKPIWLTETAQAACGGDRWAASFLDTFRYLDQLGRLAKAGVTVVMHNTLAASDYGLLDEKTFAPRPNYFGALLWRRLMGTTVLDPGVPGRAGFHVYAHCLKDRPGGVSLLVINTDSNASRALTVASPSERYTLDAAKLDGQTVRLNGHALELAANDDLPAIAGAPAPAGAQSFAPATITFLAIPEPANGAC